MTTEFLNVKSPPFLVDWWAEVREAEKVARLQAQQEDPGYPAMHGTCTGEQTVHPWSAVMGARERIPKLIAWPNVLRQVAIWMGVKCN